MPAPFQSSAVPRPGGYADIDPQTLSRHLGAVRLFDVREPHEYNDALGHVQGARLVPLATVPGALGAEERQGPVVMICRSGGRSARAAMAMAQAGFTEVYNLAGGMMGWNAAGLPVQR